MITQTYAYPFPLRPDLNVFVCGIPHDITPHEAERICRMIMSIPIPNEETRAPETPCPEGSTVDLE